MFTGLIQRTGRISALSKARSGAYAMITHAPWESALAPGESVAVNGACLTVEPVSPSLFRADLLQETMARTTLGLSKAGDEVNLERALKAGDRLGGHFVAGHVDGVGRVAWIRPEGRDRVLHVSCAAGLCGGMAVKGSVTLDGVSLTITLVDAGGFEVWLIPATVKNTTLRKLKPGYAVNIETDVLARYARTGAPAQGGGGLTLEKLRQAGLA